MPPCSSFLCPGREAEFLCGKCKEADPPTMYCSLECQQDDWKFHKQFCGKQAYVFSVKLIGSSNPPISRTVVVPSWFTFQQFHFALQYIFGSWQNCHLHNFDFVRKATPGDSRMSFGPQRQSFLQISQPEDVDVEGPSLDERKVKLSDVYEPSGVLRSKVTVNGAVVPLVYEYDFGDCWEHKITFLGAELAREARPLVRQAVGCAPVEDCGGVHGWNEVKEAFSARNPTAEQRERIAWAKGRAELGDSYDPLAPVDITPMNFEGRWENHYNNCMEEERYRVDY